MTTVPLARRLGEGERGKALLVRAGAAQHRHRRLPARSGEGTNFTATKKKKHRSPGERRPWGFISPLTSLGRGTSDKNQASACSARTAAGSGTVRTKGKRHGNCVDSPAPKVRTRGVLLLCSVCF